MQCNTRTVNRLACIVVVVLVAAVPAAAKEDPRPQLLTPLPMSAEPGSLITVRWTVTVLGPNGKRVGFSAIGMLVRLVGLGGGSTTALARETVGGPPYSARVRVPRGGIRTVHFGIADSDGITWFPDWK